MPIYRKGTYRMSVEGVRGLEITTTHRGSMVVLTITGSIDVYTASAVGETIQSLIADGAREIALDLSSVTRLDSSGLGTLVGNARSIGSSGGAIILAGMNPRVRRVLEVTNLAQYFRIADEVDRILEGTEICTISQ
jgi:anti-sigma B factor antagonist